MFLSNVKKSGMIPAMAFENCVAKTTKFDS